MLRLPPAVAVKAVEVGAELELRECVGEIHVREDEVRLRRLVRPADQHGVRAVADELDAFEVADDRMHRRGRGRAYPFRTLHRGRRDRLHLLGVDLDALADELCDELRARPHGVVRDESEPVTVVTKTLHRVGGTGYWIAGDVQDPVDVEENRRHGQIPSLFA